MNEVIGESKSGRTRAFRQWADDYVAVCDHRDIGAGEVSPECAGLISRRQARQFQMVPVRWSEGQLEIATTQQCLERALEFCMQSLTHACRFVVVSPDRLEQLVAEVYPAAAA